MYSFFPKEIPELECFYEIIPGQEQTFEDPGFEPEIEWGEIEFNCVQVSDETHHYFICRSGEKWEREIINGLKARRRAA